MTTDGEIDDRCSMIRFLLYTNEWDLQGLIHSSSKFHWKGDKEHKKQDWEPVSWLDRQLDAYEAIYDNLKQHDSRYPTPADLRARVYVGNIAYEGAMDEETPGSDHIVSVLLEDDPTEIWLQAWGGANTIARALKTIQEKHPERMADVVQKARLYLIAEQDNTLRTYILKEWPELQVLLSDWDSFGAIAYGWSKFQTTESKRYFKQDWMMSHILENHGPLCSMYEHKENRFRSEGDSPAFLHVIPTGLRSHEQPGYGGWGGRFVRQNELWITKDKRNSNPHSIVRWSIDFQNDWAARADWCVNSYEDSNHPPEIKSNSSKSITSTVGSTVELDVSGSQDPDGDQLTYEWFYYREASDYDGTLKISDPSQATTWLFVQRCQN
ncbi:MAG: DUF1593 domain-containing protein [Planctomycetaceae bacterium]